MYFIYTDFNSVDVFLLQWKYINKITAHLIYFKMGRNVLGSLAWHREIR